MAKHAPADATQKTYDVTYIRTGALTMTNRDRAAEAVKKYRGQSMAEMPEHERQRWLEEAQASADASRQNRSHMEAWKAASIKSTRSMDPEAFAELNADAERQSRERREVRRELKRWFTRVPVDEGARSYKYVPPAYVPPKPKAVESGNKRQFRTVREPDPSSVTT